MTLGELIDVWRRQSGDSVAAFLIDNAELAEFASDAVVEASRRGHLIIDSDTVEICEIDFDDTDPVLDLDPRIIVIRSAIIEGQTIPLERYTIAWMDMFYPGWRAHTAKVPTGYVADWSSNNIRLYQKQTTAGTVLLNVAREPLAPLADLADVPELPARCHRSLVGWMDKRAYSKDDSQWYSPDRAAKGEAEFVREFGEAKSMRNEKWANESPGMTADTLC